MSEQVSVQPEWCRSLTLQQQSVLLLAARGPDGIEKWHPLKNVIRAYRGCVLLAAYLGRPLKWNEGHADSFMGLNRFSVTEEWVTDVKQYLAAVDSVPHHYHLHLMHGAEILSYKHPDERFRHQWSLFYITAVEDMHLWPEPEDVMDRRLNDWDREGWS